MENFWPILTAIVLAIGLSFGAVLTVCRLLGRKTKKHDLQKRTDASGKMGEENLLRDVRLFTKTRHAKILTNVYIAGPNGHMTEIDLILIDRNGFFVFESKNYNGLVFGDEGQREWLHVLRNGDRFRFFNPVWQNRGHISAIRAMCDDLDPIYFKSVIVFGARCQFKRLRVRDPNLRIVKAGQAAHAFRELSAGTHSALSQRDISDYYLRLLPYSRSTKRQRTAHRREVQKKK